MLFMVPGGICSIVALSPEEGVCRRPQLHPSSLVPWSDVSQLGSAGGIPLLCHCHWKESIRWGRDRVCAVAAARAESRPGRVSLVYSARPL